MKFISVVCTLCILGCARVSAQNKQDKILGTWTMVDSYSDTIILVQGSIDLSGPTKETWRIGSDTLWIKKEGLTLDSIGYHKLTYRDTNRTDQNDLEIIEVSDTSYFKSFGPIQIEELRIEERDENRIILMNTSRIRNLNIIRLNERILILKEE